MPSVNVMSISYGMPSEIKHKYSVQVQMCHSDVYNETCNTILTNILLCQLHSMYSLSV
jgi:hypothetical protein